MQIEVNATDNIRLKIDALAYGPYGIGRHEGRVIMVPMTVPGDEAEVRIVEDKGNYAVGALVRIVAPSPDRQEPPCPYVGACGGCPWQMVRYEAQLAAKAKSVEEALTRIGKLKGYEMLSILASPEEYRYRRRIRLHVDRNKRIGYHRAFSHELIEVESCLIATPEADRRLGAAGAWAAGLKSTIVEVEIVESDAGGAVVLVGKVDGAISPVDDAANARFLAAHTDVQGLVLFGRQSRRAWGLGTVVVELEDGLQMEVDAEVFIQVNRAGNRRLVSEFLEWGGFGAGDRVLELYSGAGNFTLPVAKRAGTIVAVEGDERAVRNGKKNSRAGGLENIRWVQSHAPHAARELRQAGSKFSKIILNPPRSGAKGLEDDLAALGAEKILYVSCNPATLARDLAALDKKGYSVKRVRPVDLFPHTFHVETLAEAALR
ncbi:MAG TPA: 23S rRNA (uracil(1939)-C(5))-methyltransferase RlmD [Candidatus Binatia bacterium]